MPMKRKRKKMEVMVMARCFLLVTFVAGYGAILGTNIKNEPIYALQPSFSSAIIWGEDPT